MGSYQVAIGPQAFKVQAVDGGEHHDLLVEMQKVCLPYDTPIDPAIGQWWLVWNTKHEAVAFAVLKPVATVPHYAYLARAGVIPGWRGRGLQRRLIMARLRAAKRGGFTHAITDTTNNPPSANSLIRCGFKTYTPEAAWGTAATTYWIRKL